MAYYYLLSSLPMLKSDSLPPFSYTEFLDMCKNTVSPHKYTILKELTPHSTKGPLIAEWAKFYSALTSELSYQRKMRLGKKAQPVYPKDEELSKVVTSAMQANPLQGEEELLSLQFKKLDELIGTHYFDDYALMGYALKLKLLERKSQFIKQTGKAEFDRIVGEIQQQITSMQQE